MYAMILRTVLDNSIVKYEPRAGSYACVLSFTPASSGIAGMCAYLLNVHRCRVAWISPDPAMIRIISGYRANKRASHWIDPWQMHYGVFRKGKAMTEMRIATQIWSGVELEACHWR